MMKAKFSDYTVVLILFIFTALGIIIFIVDKQKDSPALAITTIFGLGHTAVTI
ncbi:hypothetical protein [Candidatus Uabimicrobium sp. HlEnr_7]|uniref:hypothetical protein n=1 Tax=Candidatus Uabimicrobium helgolandensis TaxID=3095367 RepID=UPI0035561B33